MIFKEETYKYMYAALLEAERALEEDEVPVGAVIVYNSRIIGKGYNQTERLGDPTAHAEMLAITAASNHLKNKFLNECELYVTVEPCLMCAGAILLARLKRIYFSVFEPKLGACGSIYNVMDNNKYNQNVEVYSGVYSEESKKLMQKFFEAKRSK